jgi:hypothetical protein
VIWHPGSLALLTGSGAVLILLIAVAPRAVRILRRWDIESSSEAQFTLEKSTYLLSAVAGWAVAVNAASLFLFIAVADDFRHSLTGAMCATGALNANPVGWAALGVKALLLPAGWIWVLVNSLDNRSPGYPLIRFTYGFLLVLIPLFALDFILLGRYLGGLEPDVITSCCGSLFSTAVKEPGNVLAALPPRLMMTAHHASVAAAWLLGGLALWRGGRALSVGYAVYSVLFLPFALASVVSFIAPYIYGLPTHHCPFDMFQGAYGFVGYPLFLSLFAATVWGVLPGLVISFARRAGLAAVLPGAMRRWVAMSLFSRALFDGLVYYYVYAAGMTLY